MTIGDFRKTLAPGWEAEIQDPLRREDIADAACGDPQSESIAPPIWSNACLPWSSAGSSATNWKGQKSRAQIAERKTAETRARQPWVAFAVIALWQDWRSASPFIVEQFANVTMPIVRLQLPVRSTSFSPKICWDAAILL